MPSRPVIPAEIKLAVRKKCKFQCVICGCPIYDYEHLEEWHIVHKHSIDNIFLLCPTHHRQKTNGQISKTTILEHFNKLEGTYTTPEPLFIKDYKIILGNNEFHTQSGYIFRILNKDYFQIQSVLGNLIVNCAIWNKSDQLAFRIINNEYSQNAEIWDINNIGNTTTFRNSRNDIFLKITFDGEHRQIRILGKLYLDENTYLWIKETGIYLNGKLLANNCTVQNISGNGLIIAQQKSQIGSNVGFSNCTGISNSFAQNCSTGFAWSLDHLHQ